MSEQKTKFASDTSGRSIKEGPDVRIFNARGDVNRVYVPPLIQFSHKKRGLTCQLTLVFLAENCHFPVRELYGFFV